jgi:hypothetical protein
VNNIDTRLYGLFSQFQSNGLSLDDALFPSGTVGKHTMAAKLEARLREANRTAPETPGQRTIFIQR